MLSLNIAIFTYDCPHKKTNDFLMDLIIKDYHIKCVIAAKLQKLNFPHSILRVKPKYDTVYASKEICNRFNIPYCVVDKHNCEDTENILQKRNIDLGIIAGARILKENIINSVNFGIINLHPGLIPEIRGLDALKWSIYNNIPIGVTSHLIDKRVDAGTIIKKAKIKIEKDDSLIDLSIKISDLERKLLIDSLEIINSNKKCDFEQIPLDTTQFNTNMESAVEKQVIKKYREYINNNSDT